jgi:hypothetical protein
MLLIYRLFDRLIIDLIDQSISTIALDMDLVIKIYTPFYIVLYCKSLFHNVVF